MPIPLQFVSLYDGQEVFMKTAACLSTKALDGHEYMDRTEQSVPLLIIVIDMATFFVFFFSFFAWGWGWGEVDKWLLREYSRPS